jgi:hypothetical protein
MACESGQKVVCNWKGTVPIRLRVNAKTENPLEDWRTLKPHGSADGPLLLADAGSGKRFRMVEIACVDSTAALCMIASRERTYQKSFSYELCFTSRRKSFIQSAFVDVLFPLRI